MQKIKLKFNSSVCTTREQSQRLLELGLKPETADMAHIAFGGGGMMIRPYNWVSTTEVDINNFYPAWSLHRLIELLPNEILMEDYYLILGASFDYVCYADNEYAEVFQSFNGNTYSCIIKCVEWLIKEGYFNKEYLKQ